MGEVGGKGGYVYAVEEIEVESSRSKIGGSVISIDEHTDDRPTDPPTTDLQTYQLSGHNQALAVTINGCVSAMPDETRRFGLDGFGYLCYSL